MKKGEKKNDFSELWNVNKDMHVDISFNFGTSLLLHVWVELLHVTDVAEPKTEHLLSLLFLFFLSA